MLPVLMGRITQRHQCRWRGSCDDRDLAGCRRSTGRRSKVFSSNRCAFN